MWGIAAPLGQSPRALPHRADVVIVGGGITGVTLLGLLGQRHVDAVLVERDQIAAGASGRNAGFLLAGVAENYARAVHIYGRDVARAVWEFTLENHALTAAAVERIDAGYQRRGSLTAALDASEAACLEEAATLLVEDGFAAELGGGRGLRDARLTLFNPADGEIDPVRLVHGLAVAHSDRIFQHCPVVAVEDGHNSANVGVDGGGSIEAGAVVVATNGWTAQLLPAVPIRPVRAQMLATAPAAGVVSWPVYAEWGHRYWRQRDDGVVLVGGFRNRAFADEVGYDGTPTAPIQRCLDSQLSHLGVEAAVTHRWAGIMGFSDDGLPLVGIVPGCRRVHVCGGYTGHGMGFAINAARASVGQLLDSQALPPWLDITRVAALTQ
ncbi:MAG: FAD-binding oxidoreductase [Candidatus Dormibacteraeota bacterium]|uniref:FAD-binding oxidoreductase n=1 Tax=Candidatus Amunia macphersoniae TaxID=3127014 RepID=A0A934N9C8_9BACT|nr:FAD-binding oxidoreductase [Candidatus Dormibacteraeota bacterium]